MQKKKQDTGNLDPDGPFATGGESRPEATQEKTSIGGKFNSGVTSSDGKTKDAIEKQGTMLKNQPDSANDEKKDDEAH